MYINSYTKLQFMHVLDNRDFKINISDVEREKEREREMDRERDRGREG